MADNQTEKESNGVEDDSVFDSKADSAAKPTMGDDKKDADRTDGKSAVPASGAAASNLAHQIAAETANSSRNLSSVSSEKPATNTKGGMTTLKPGEQNVVIALDGSDQSVQAVNWYLDKVHRQGNRLVFVHVIELPEPKLNEARSLHMSPGVLASMWKEEEARVKELEQKMKAVLKEKQIKGVLRTATGKPGEVICRIAEEENAAMICVGTRGMGRVRRTILGSVSDFLVHHAHCPVIVCRSRTRKQSGDDRTRNKSGEGRRRHFSGESIKKIFNLGSKRSQSTSSESDLDVKTGEAAGGASGSTLKEEEEKSDEAVAAQAK